MGAREPLVSAVAYAHLYCFFLSSFTNKATLKSFRGCVSCNLNAYIVFLWIMNALQSKHQRLASKVGPRVVALSLLRAAVMERERERERERKRERESQRAE